jgi:8-oxo-dGTP diphosphatase
VEGPPATLAACVVVQSGTGVLLVHNSYGDRRWSLPGGAVDAGESPADAAVREAREEAGVEVELGDFIGVCVISRPNKPVHIVFGFYATIVSGEPRVVDPVEIDEVAWFHVKDWPEPRTTSGPVFGEAAAAGLRGIYRDMRKPVK